MPYVTSHLNQIVRRPVMVRFKLKLKSIIFIARSSEHSSTLILNLNDTAESYRIHFLQLWTTQPPNLSSLFLIWDYLKWHLLLCHSTWEKMGRSVARHCFTLEGFSLRLSPQVGNPAAWVITYQRHSHCFQFCPVDFVKTFLLSFIMPLLLYFLEIPTWIVCCTRK